VSYFSWIPSLSAVGACFTFDCNVYDTIRSKSVIKIVESAAMLQASAGLVSLVAFAALGEIIYLYAALVLIPLGLAMWVYLTDYEFVLNDLSQRKSVDDSAAKIGREQNEIDVTIDRLENEIKNLKATNGMLESQLEDLSQINSTFEPTIDQLREENRNLVEVKDKLSHDLKEFVDLQNKMQKIIDNLEDKIEEDSKVHTAEAASYADRVRLSRERIEKIESAYAKIIVNEKLVEQIESLKKINGSEVEKIYKKLPALRNLTKG
jgi:hypothetical protein